MKRTAVGTPPVSAPRGEWYGGSMALGDCSFETDRLVDDWSRLLTGDAAEALRDGFVVSLLTAAVTRDLPPGWQGPYDMDRAASWFAERLREGTVLVVGGRSDGRPVGLLILSESENSDRARDVRLGDVFAESVWAGAWRPRSSRLLPTGAEPTDPYGPSLAVSLAATVHLPGSFARTDSFLTPTAWNISPTRWSTP